MLQTASITVFIRLNAEQCVLSLIKMCNQTKTVHLCNLKGTNSCSELTRRFEMFSYFCFFAFCRIKPFKLISRFDLIFLWCSFKQIICWFLCVSSGFRCHQSAPRLLQSSVRGGCVVSVVGEAGIFQT